MTPNDAEAVALSALAWLAADPDRLSLFLAETGLDLDALRSRAADLDFLAGVLDFLLADEGRVTGFAESADLMPEMPAQARRQLPGGHFHD